MIKLEEKEVYKNKSQCNVWQQAVSAVAVAVVATGLVAPRVFADDTTYTVSQPPKSIVFNQIKDNKDWGDEHDFVLVKDVTDKYKGYSSIAELAKGKEGFSKEAELHEGHLYMVKTLVHNDADKSLNLVAKNTKVNTAATPNPDNTSIELKTTISADNCGATSDNAGSKCAVSGVATLKRKDGDTNTYAVENDSGWFDHTLYFNSERGLGTNGFMLNERDIADDKVGVLIGSKQLDGNMVGADDAGYVINFIHVESMHPSFNLYNNVSVVNPSVANKDRAMPTIVRANPGDTVKYKVEYRPQSPNKDVKLRSYLFPGAKYISNSVKWVEGDGNNAKSKDITSDKWIMESDSVANEALSIGDADTSKPNYITYLVKVPEKDKLACGVNRLENVALVTAKVNGEDVKKVASSTIVVEGDKCPDSGTANTNSNDNSPEGPNDNHNADQEHSRGNQGGAAQSDVCPSNHRIKAGDKRCVGAPRAGVKIATATVSLLSFLGLASFIVYRLMKANNKARDIEKIDN